jgi:predicted nucleic acid-binding protein
MNDPIILDTCVFFDKAFLHKLKTYHGEKVIPAVAYSELCVHFIKNKKKDDGFVDKVLRSMDIQIERFDAHNAKYAAKYCQDGPDFKKHNRDYFIGSHAWPPPKIMITNNTKDFIFLGKIRVMEPWTFINKYKI